MMNIESRINKLENLCLKEHENIIIDGHAILVKNGELLGVLSEIIQASREERPPVHRLIDKGVLTADRGQSKLLDLVLMLHQSIRGDDIND